MDLKCLWIKKFRNIEEQGFSFTDKYIINYSSISKELSITPNANSIPDGFYASNIVSLTGILGENGAGKSNILDFIITRIGTVYNGGHDVYDDQYIVILGKTIFKHNQIELSLQNEVESLGFTIIDFDESLEWLSGEMILNWERRKKLYNTKYIFYSSAFERQVDFRISNLINVSNSFEVSESIFRNDFPNGYRNKEISSQLEFLTYLRDNETVKIPFDIPKHINIEVELTNIASNRLGINEKQLQDKKLGWLDFLLEINSSTYNDFYSDRSHLQQLTTLFIINLTLVTFTYNSSSIINISKRDIYDFVKLRFDKDHFSGTETNKFYNDLLDLRDTINALHESGYMRIYISNEKERYLFNIYNSFELEINNVTKDLFYKFYIIYNYLSNNNNFILRHWEGLSSGQQAYLNILSRLFESYNRVQQYELEDNNGFRSDHCTIMIDEGETFFHPQWQKQYLNIIVNFLTTLFRGRNLQIIISSNSPFIASDIPTSNLIFIKRGDEGRCEVHKQERNCNTFAANIHTLFTDSFFLQEGLMGDFAKQKLNRLITYLKTPALENEERAAMPPSESIKQEMKQLIQIIGEPVIRHKLEEMWLEKFGVEDEIEIPQRRLQEAMERRNPRQ